MKTITQKIILATTIGLLSASVLAAGSGKMKEQSDAPQFQVIDTNSDGGITQNEYQAYMQQRAEQLTDDGKQMKNAEPHDFTDMDTNKDGVIDSNEFGAHQQSTMTRDKTKVGSGKSVMNKGDKGNKGNKGDKGDRSERGMGQLFGVIDTNENGSITKAEYQLFNQQRFDRLDTNHDGVLDATEFTPASGKDQGKNRGN